ncbi:MAG: phenylacetate--CoA ligase family protein [Archangiaceae bacterium]|nr:phenylacetate--CoA ligase family protein [Archangiaceae bacterium]
MIALRKSVEVIPRGGAQSELVDHDTGLTLTVEGFSLDGDSAAALRALGLLEEEGLSLAEVRERQRPVRLEALASQRLEQWRELIAFAAAKVPFYRERSAQYDADALETLDDVAALPLMRKADVRANFPGGLVAEGIDVGKGIEGGNLELAGSSGTTEERLQVVSDLELTSMPDDFEALWHLPETDATPRTAVLTSPTCMGTQCHLGLAPYENRLRQQYTLFLNSTPDLFTTPKSTLENVAEELGRFGADMLLVNPVYLHWFARRCRELNVALPRPRIVLSCYQYLTRFSRRAITELLGVPVYDYYGSTDLGGARTAVECDRGRLHVREDHVSVEVLGKDGPKAPGELGALAVTALANRVMPLVRYLVGDVGKLVEKSCDCLLSDWACLELHGRSKDMLQLNGGWVTTRMVDDALSKVSGIDFYRVDQTGASELRVQAVPSLERSFDPREVEGTLREALKVGTVRVDTVKRLEPEPSLKYRLTECKVAQPPELP